MKNGAACAAPRIRFGEVSQSAPQLADLLEWVPPRKVLPPLLFDASWAFMPKGNCWIRWRTDRGYESESILRCRGGRKRGGR